MQLAMHHSSIDREQREVVEQRLREGTVKCVVCTSSLDLGVDFSPVEQVIQVGSPKGIARLLAARGPQRPSTRRDQPRARRAHECAGDHRILCRPRGHGWRGASSSGGPY
jgi:ATP-dependent helicase YprA (DUF1998 family)